MGTNFYIRGHHVYGRYSGHIGKRSAAGLYCWDCDVTLCKVRVHYSQGEGDWHDCCPKCGKEKDKEPLDQSSGGRELGFNKIKPARKTGVKTCSSFSWAMAQDDLKQRLAKEPPSFCPACKRIYDDLTKVIVDEYGDTYTWEEFQDVLEECPLRFYDSIGKDFS